MQMTDAEVAAALALAREVQASSHALGQSLPIPPANGARTRFPAYEYAWRLRRMLYRNNGVADRTLDRWGLSGPAQQAAEWAMARCQSELDGEHIVADARMHSETEGWLTQRNCEMLCLALLADFVQHALPIVTAAPALADAVESLAALRDELRAEIECLRMPDLIAEVDRAMGHGDDHD